MCLKAPQALRQKPFGLFCITAMYVLLAVCCFHRRCSNGYYEGGVDREERAAGPSVQAMKSPQFWFHIYRHCQLSSRLSGESGPSCPMLPSPGLLATSKTLLISLCLFFNISFHVILRLVLSEDSTVTTGFLNLFPSLATYTSLSLMMLYTVSF